MDGILEPIKRNSVHDVDNYLTNHGSLQRSLTQEMGRQVFDERVLKALERTEKDMNINNIEVLYSIKSALVDEVALYSVVPTENSLNIWKFGFAMVIISAILALIHIKLTRKGKNQDFSAGEIGRAHV